MKKSADQWLIQYSTAHQHPTNRRIHAIAVPMIFWCIVALFATFPPFALILLFPAFVFYFRLGNKYGLMMVVATGFCLMTAYAMIIRGLPVHHIAVALFILAWIAQFYGHKVEGQRPSFLEDLLFLLIGPLWTLRNWRVL